MVEQLRRQSAKREAQVTTAAFLLTQQMVILSLFVLSRLTAHLQCRLSRADWPALRPDRLDMKRNQTDKGRIEVCHALRYRRRADEVLPCQ